MRRNTLYQVNKKGVSIMVGYVLLVSIAVVIGAMVYAGLKTYVPRDTPDCPDGTALSIEELSCINYGGIYELNVTLENSGRFNIAGFFIYATESEIQELAANDLSGNITKGGTELSNSVIFSESGGNPLEPTDEIETVFRIAYPIYSLEISPTRFQTLENKIEFVVCGDAKIKEVVDCG